MFQFCNQCTNEYVNAPSWITQFVQSLSAIAALFALYFAWRNLAGLRRTQSLQAQMSLINLENEVRKNYTQLRLAQLKYSEAISINASEKLLFATLEKDNAFMLYFSTADKLAALIDSEFLTGQFKNRDWKAEYFDIFKEVKKIYETDDLINSGESHMIENVKKILAKWSFTKG